MMVLCATSITKSEGKLIVLDIQGSNQFLYDLEIASSDLLSEDGKILFCNGDYSKDGIKNFFSKHLCNNCCKMLTLSLQA